MKPATETKIIRGLQLACAAMVLGIVLNVPHPNGRGGVRDQFVEGWRLAQAEDDNQAPAPPAEPAPDVAQGGDR